MSDNGNLVMSKCMSCTVDAMPEDGFVECVLDDPEYTSEDCVLTESGEVQNKTECKHWKEIEFVEKPVSGRELQSRLIQAMEQLMQASQKILAGKPCRDYDEVYRQCEILLKLCKED